MRWTLDNWQIKLVALFLAVALWFYTSGQARTERSFTVQVGIASVRAPEGVRVVRVEPGAEFTVEVDGPLTVLRDLRSAVLTPRLELDARAVAEGRQQFPITSQVLGLPADVRVQRVLPATDAITVTVDRVVTAQMLVDPPPVVKVPEGFEPALAVEDGRANVTGPQVAVAEVAKLRRLPFKPVSMEHANTQVARPQTIRLRLEPDLAAPVEVSPVWAVVTLKPIDAVRQKIDLPLHLLAPPDFLRKHRVELGQPQVVVSVRGPRSLIAGLTPDSLTAFVNLRRPLELNQPQEVPVEVLAPAWATVDPVTVRLTITVRTEAAPAPAPSPLEGDPR